MAIKKKTYKPIYAENTTTGEWAKSMMNGLYGKPKKAKPKLPFEINLANPLWKQRNINEDHMANKDKLKFSTEEELQEFVDKQMALIRKIFKGVTEAERSFYGYSPSKQKADTLKAGNLETAHQEDDSYAALAA